MRDAGKASFLRECPVSRETMVSLEALVCELERWTRHINLVSPASLVDVWRRHVLDSAQLFAMAPARARSWVDLGAGAGFPGLVIAALARTQRPELRVTLVESDARKCAFLATAARSMNVQILIENRRIEQSTGLRYDVVSARALAALPMLVALSAPYMERDAVALFPKGANVDDELTEVLKAAHVEVARTPSITDPMGVVLQIRGISRARSQE